VLAEKTGHGMPRSDKTLDRMRANPRDWRISNLKRSLQRTASTPKPGGSHVVFEHPGVPEAVSVPERRPIRPIYIRRFIAFIEAVRANDE
jgi:hypothetical protein